MRKVATLLSLLACIPLRVSAQASDSEVPRYEIGAQFDFNHLSGTGEPGGGVGVRFDYNFDDHFAFDAELTHREHTLLPPTGLPPNPIIAQNTGLFGLRAGVRAWSGLFLHARGGFVNFGSSDGNSLLTRRTFAAAEFGGTVENYYGPLILRLDVGGMIIPYGNARLSPAFLTAPSSTRAGPLGTRASSLVGLGFAIRF
jgi:hypothetical protein